MAFFYPTCAWGSRVENDAIAEEDGLKEVALCNADVGVGLMYLHIYVWKKIIYFPWAVCYVQYICGPGSDHLLTRPSLLGPFSDFRGPQNEGKKIKIKIKVPSHKTWQAKATLITAPILFHKTSTQTHFRNPAGLIEIPQTKRNKLSHTKRKPSQNTLFGIASEEKNGSGMKS